MAPIWLQRSLSRGSWSLRREGLRDTIMESATVERWSMLFRRKADRRRCFSLDWSRSFSLFSCCMLSSTILEKVSRGGTGDGDKNGEVCGFGVEGVCALGSGGRMDGFAEGGRCRCCCCCCGGSEGELAIDAAPGCARKIACAKGVELIKGEYCCCCCCWRVGAERRLPSGCSLSSSSSTSSLSGSVLWVPVRSS